MLLPLALFLFAPDVDGLRDGESARWLPAAPEVLTNDDVPLRRYEVGRVIDAFTGYPIEGAQVEAWTEEITAQSGGLRRVGEALTDATGQVRVRVRDGGLSAEKVRVRAGGYLTFSGTPGDLERARLVPQSEEPPRLEVLDVLGRPIEGARVTTTYSCAHDLPAFEAETDAFGRVTLHEYGYQDHESELRIRAPGYAGHKYYSEVLVPADGGTDRVMLLRAPRQRGVFLDAAGLPLAFTTLWAQDGDGYHIGVTKEDGRVEFEERYDGEEFYVRSLQNGEDRHLYSGPLPWDLEPVIAPRLDADRIDALPRGTLRIVSPEEGYVPYYLFHESGFTEDGPGQNAEPIECPEGWVTVEYGTPFREWLPGRHRVQVVAGQETVLELDPRPALWVAVKLPTDEKTTLTFQSGENAIQHLVGTTEDADLVSLTSFAVPHDQDLVVVAVGPDTRRTVVPASSNRTALGSEDAPALVIDLTGDDKLVESLLPDPAPDRSEEIDFLVSTYDEEGNPMVGKLHATGHTGPAVLPMSRGQFRVTCGKGERLLLRFTAPGYAETGAHWIARNNKNVVLETTSLSTIVIESDTPYVVEEPYHETLENLHPGPIRPVIQFTDGRRLALDLYLEPGEIRTLRVD